MEDKKKRGLLLISASFLAIAGLLAALTGILFIVGDHPFHREGGFSEEMGMTKTEIEAFNPKIVDWTMHVSDQVGSVSMGWGLFIIVLSWFGIRRENKVAWYALWIAGTPTLFISSFGEIIQFGTFDVGSVLSIGVFILFMIGMLLPIRIFLQPKIQR